MSQRRLVIVGCIFIVGLLIALLTIDHVGQTSRGEMLVSVIGQAATDWLFRILLIVGIALTAYYIYGQSKVHDRLDRRARSFNLLDRSHRRDAGDEG